MCYIFFHSYFFHFCQMYPFGRSQTGVHIFTKRPKSRNGSNLSPDDVVTYLGKHSRALLLYLEHLVLEEKIQVKMDLLFRSWRPMWPRGFRASKSIQPSSECLCEKQKHYFYCLLLLSFKYWAFLGLSILACVFFGPRKKNSTRTWPCCTWRGFCLCCQNCL